MNNSKNGSQKIFLLCLLLSFLLIHIPLFLFIKTIDFTSKEPDQSLKSNKSAPVMMIDLKKPTASLPLVAIDKPKNQTPPKRASAVSTYNSSVAKEQVSLGIKKHSGGGAGQPSQTPPTQKSSSQSQSQQTPQKNLASQQPNPNQNTTLTPEQKLLMLKSNTTTQEQQKYQERFASNSTPQNFKTNFSAGAPSGDFLPNYKVGNRTYLNTLANPHVGFFVELKRRFGIAFNPVPVLRRSLNFLGGRRQILTVWGLSVDQTGRVVDMKLIKSSGIEGYDYEAKRTMQQSAPYSRPPMDLIGNDHMLHMAWTFVVYL